MIASALSMGSGAYLAAKSEREIYEAEFSRERDAVNTTKPKHEKFFRSATKSVAYPQKSPTFSLSI